jgi:hypothetical protein
VGRGAGAAVCAFAAALAPTGTWRTGGVKVAFNAGGEGAGTRTAVGASAGARTAVSAGAVARILVGAVIELGAKPTRDRAVA